MDEVIKLLNENKYGFLATVDGARPRVRPFGFMFEEGGSLYFCTNCNKNVYRQLLACPQVEYALTSPKMVTVRITGEAIFTEDMDKKEKAIMASELVRRIYQTADNPIFKVFRIEHGTAVISDFSGKPPRTVEF